MDAVANILNMGGYATYVWSAYGLVLGILGLQLMLSWRRWQKLNNKNKNKR